MAKAASRRSWSVSMASRHQGASSRPHTANWVGSEKLTDTGRMWTQSRPVSTQGVLSAQIKVTSRPVTQQGLSGMKTDRKGPQRQVLDKSYYLGLLQNKVNTLTTEMSKIQKEIETFTQENSLYLFYEKRAEGLAGEIKCLQEQLADYNILIDKLNTNTELEEIKNDFIMMKAQNDREALRMEVIFVERKEKEDMIRAVREDIERAKRAMDDTAKKMSPKKQAKYAEMKTTIEKLLQEMETQEKDMDTLLVMEKALEAELVHSEVKQEAVFLYNHLQALELCHDNILAKGKSASSNMDERECLLRQMNGDYQEIDIMNQQLAKTQEKIHQLKKELQQHKKNTKGHETECGLNKKYYEMQKKEQAIDAYLKTFEESKVQEMEHIQECNRSIMDLQERSSRMAKSISQLSSISPHELKSIQEDLKFKESEIQKLQSTANGLSSKCEYLQQHLIKIEELKEKVVTEIGSLNERILQMNEGLKTCKNLEDLRAAGKMKKKRLMEQRDSLMKKRDTLKEVTHKINQKYEALASQLNKNEIHLQLTSLEKKWQHIEQNNCTMKEFIASKVKEGDYAMAKKNVTIQAKKYNKLLTDRWRTCRSAISRACADR